MSPQQGNPHAKVLVFTQWANMVRLLEHFLATHAKGYTVLSIKGKDKPNDRCCYASRLVHGMRMRRTHAVRVTATTLCAGGAVYSCTRRLRIRLCW